MSVFEKQKMDNGDHYSAADSTYYFVAARDSGGGGGGGGVIISGGGGGVGEGGAGAGTGAGILDSTVKGDTGGSTGLQGAPRGGESEGASFRIVGRVGEPDWRMGFPFTEILETRRKKV